ncbi:MAG TPA: peptidoglycan DD-metalloendopeptidase family protein [Candidatus Krumholzibacteria bacterium]|nr:peptidoglycan DD-metalloendopeptidase family protein [Candidatus Krumholzibacteria bacterium]HRX52385.1 peptidoglycan DD-metalloendopeptidase family protein [Candidatus Krumholzibacteria bacterium]
MKRWVTVVGVLALAAAAFGYEVVPVAAPESAAASAGHGGGWLDTAADEPCLTAEQRAAIKVMLADSAAELRARGLLPAPDASAAVTGLIWPVRAAAHVHDPGVHGISNFVDQNAAFPDQLLDYDCGARTYDLTSGYNHQGTDIFTWPFSWHKMDDDDVEVVAAAPGVILQKSDGNYDRQCGFGTGNWNAVYVQHADGSVAWYGHMKNGSLTAKTVGQSVAAGEFLGVVGSSGNSTGPHLHLELYDPAGNLADPWAGACNSLNPTSWWLDQPPYYDSAVNALRTGSAAPAFQSCPTPAVTGESLQFQAGDLVYFTTFYRDQLQGQVSTYRVLRPDGTLWREWTGSSNQPHYAASYWWWSWFLPVDAADGWWTFRVIYQGVATDHSFAVGQAGPTDAGDQPRATRLHAATPNPFNPATEIAFSLERPAHVRLRVHDLRGRVAAVLWDGPADAGRHAVTWRGRDDLGRRLAGGAYVVRLESDDGAWSRAVTLLE